MNTVGPETALAFSGRFRFIFSASGQYGTCVRMADEEQILEKWTFTAGRSQHCAVPDVAASSATHALPLDDGRILLLDSAGSNSSRKHLLTLLRPGEGESHKESIGTIPCRLGGYLLPSPSAAQLGFLVALDSGHSTIWRISTSPPSIEFATRVPGLLDGGTWLDDDGNVLAVNQTCGRYRPNGVAVDLTEDSWRIIWSRSVTSTDRILLSNPWSKTIIVTTTATGEQRLGWASVGDRTVHFPEALYHPGYERRALALDDRGERLLVHEVTGTVSRLFIYSLAEDRLVPLPCPPGKISAPASWVGDHVRFRFSAPTQPPTLATVQLAGVPRWSVSRDHDVQDHRTTPGVELVQLQGRAGTVEAIVYGGARWRACEHLVVALHGGPLSAWRFGFEPLFHCLSAADIAVVAPNYRGSTGYGDEHRRAVIGHWGGPDLDDVLDLGSDLEKDRARHQLPRPVVLGVSYGAFLALLAACDKPQFWSACVALAPFLSGPRFYASASFAVQRRIEQLGGLRRIEDAAGPRDALQACTKLSAPLLLMHGVRDETIPVTQSRMLRQRLLALGKTEEVDFEYVEADSTHGELLQRKDLSLRVARFCRTRSELDSNHKIGNLISRLPHRAPSHFIGKWKK